MLLREKCLFQPHITGLNTEQHEIMWSLFFLLSNLDKQHKVVKKKQGNDRSYAVFSNGFMTLKLLNGHIRDIRIPEASRIQSQQESEWQESRQQDF